MIREKVPHPKSNLWHPFFPHFSYSMYCHSCKFYFLNTSWIFPLLPTFTVTTLVDDTIIFLLGYYKSLQNSIPNSTLLPHYHPFSPSPQTQALNSFSKLQSGWFFFLPQIWWKNALVKNFQTFPMTHRTLTLHKISAWSSLSTSPILCLTTPLSKLWATLAFV